MPTRLAVAGDAARLLVVANNNKVAAHCPANYAVWDAQKISRYCFAPNARTAVATNAGGTILAWIAGMLVHETDENDNGDGVTLVHHRYARINHFAIHTSVTNAQITANMRDVLKQLLVLMQAFSITDIQGWPILNGSVLTQAQADLAVTGDALSAPFNITTGTPANPAVIARLLKGKLSDWVARMALV